MIKPKTSDLQDGRYWARTSDLRLVEAERRPTRPTRTFRLTAENAIDSVRFPQYQETV